MVAVEHEWSSMIRAEQETGQIMIHKRIAWRGLWATTYLNRHSEYYNKLIWGDKQVMCIAKWYEYG